MQKRINNQLFLEKIISLYPNFTFRSGQKFKFRQQKTIYYSLSETDNFPILLLHELAHANLGHYSFETNLERLKIESAAWEETKNLCQKFNLSFSDDFAKTELDTYRDWLHQKSLCRNCGLIRFETSDGNYHCPRCELLLKS